jgi:hypothetical protein
MADTNDKISMTDSDAKIGMSHINAEVSVAQTDLVYLYSYFTQENQLTFQGKKRF